MSSRSAAETLPDLTGRTAFEAGHLLAEAGFRLSGSTPGGYLKYVHTDRSKIWVRPNGEVIRLGPPIRSAQGKKYNPRFDQGGQRTQAHSTGEKLAL